MPTNSRADTPREQLAYELVKSWPHRERQEIANWLSGALTGHSSFLSPSAAGLLKEFKVRFPDMST